MAGDRQLGLCPLCGRAQVICEAHHAAFRVHAPSAVIAVCVVSCHPVLTERARDAGVLLAHEVEHPEAERVWAIARGLSDLPTLVAYNTPALGEREAQRSELVGIALGRIVDMLYRAAGEPGIAGPNPRANDLRRAGRRKHRVVDVSRPHKAAPPHDPSLDPARARALLEVIAEASHYLPEAEAMASDRSRVARLADAVGALADALASLETRGRGPELLDAVRRDAQVVHGVLRSSLELEQADELARLVLGLVEVKRISQRFLRLVEDLVAAADEHELGRAVDAYLRHERPSIATSL